jgi:hypothetical protein
MSMGMGVGMGRVWVGMGMGIGMGIGMAEPSLQNILRERKEISTVQISFSL